MKKLLAVLLAMSFCLVFFGCAKKDDDKKDDKKNDTAANEAEPEKENDVDAAALEKFLADEGEDLMDETALPAGAAVSLEDGDTVVITLKRSTEVTEEQKEQIKKEYKEQAATLVMGLSPLYRGIDEEFDADELDYVVRFVDANDSLIFEEEIDFSVVPRNMKELKNSALWDTMFSDDNAESMIPVDGFNATLDVEGTDTLLFLFTAEQEFTEEELAEIKEQAEEELGDEDLEDMLDDSMFESIKKITLISKMNVTFRFVETDGTVITEASASFGD